MFSKHLVKIGANCISYHKILKFVASVYRKTLFHILREGVGTKYLLVLSVVVGFLPPPPTLIHLHLLNKNVKHWQLENIKIIRSLYPMGLPPTTSTSICLNWRCFLTFSEAVIIFGLHCTGLLLACTWQLPKSAEVSLYPSLGIAFSIVFSIWFCYN